MGKPADGWLISSAMKTSAPTAAPGLRAEKEPSASVAFDEDAVKVELKAVLGPLAAPARDPGPWQLLTDLAQAFARATSHPLRRGKSASTAAGRNLEPPRLNPKN